MKQTSLITNTPETALAVSTSDMEHLLQKEIAYLENQLATMGHPSTPDNIRTYNLMLMRLLDRRNTLVALQTGLLASTGS